MKNSFFFCLLFISNTAIAQFLTAPPNGGSQFARVTQGVGTATVTVEYHSPDVDGRQDKIWGGLVPYNRVWRTGANENTTITFSHQAKVAGQVVPAGTYGLFTVPGEMEWTVIFSKTHTAWGDFVYDEKEDQLRFTVVPQTAEYHEFLTFEFTERKPEQAVLALKWEHLSVPFRIEFAVHDLAVAGFREQLKSDLGLFFWEGTYQAATYCFDNDVYLEQGFAWAEESVEINPVFKNLLLKSRFLEKMGKQEEAKEEYELAIKMGTVTDLYQHGKKLLSQENTTEAMSIFNLNLERFGDMYLVHLGLARGFEANGDLVAALKHYKKGLFLADLPRRQAAMEAAVYRLEGQLKG